MYILYINRDIHSGSDNDHDFNDGRLARGAPVDDQYLPLAEHSHLQELVFPQRSAGQGRTPLLVAPRSSGGGGGRSSGISSRMMLMDAIPPMMESNRSSGSSFGFSVSNHAGGGSGIGGGGGSGSSDSHALVAQRSIPVNFVSSQRQQQQHGAKNRAKSAQRLPIAR